MVMNNCSFPFDIISEKSLKTFGSLQKIHYFCSVNILIMK